MKRVYNFMTMALVVIGAALLSSCENEISGNYLKVSDSTFSLDGPGVEEFTIEVSATSTWTYTINDSWIIEVDSDKNGITVKGEAYYGSDMRVGSITITSDDATVTVTVFQLYSLTSVVTNDIFTYGAVSPDGYYIGGVEYYDDDWAIPTLIDTRTGDYVQFSAIDSDYVASAVDNNGNMFFNSSFMTEGIHIDVNTGEVASVEYLAGQTSAGVNGVSGDGTIWAGYALYNYKWVPMKWVNGVPELLPCPAENGTGMEDIWYGAAARGCNDDGSIIYGNIMDHQEGVYWDANGDFHFVAPELLEYSYDSTVDAEFAYELTAGARIYDDKERISPDGKWLSFIYENDTTGASYPGYIEIATGTVTLLSSWSGYDIFNISNDFDLVFYAPYGYLLSTTILTAAGEKMDSLAWIEQQYGLIIEDTRAVTQIAANGNISGLQYQSSGSYLTWWLKRE